MDVLLVHGYNVTSTRTYGMLPQRLKRAGHTVHDVYLAKYVTLDDDLTLDDLARAFEAALREIRQKSPKKKWACITHSTGGLLIRHWIDLFYRQSANQLPFSHVILLAAPNHGSRLSSLNRSRRSRLRSIWGFDSGQKILSTLALGSRFQDRLNQSWMENRYHERSGFFTFAIAGQKIDRELSDPTIPATRERGSDGVVRVASANLNTRRISVSTKRKISTETISGVPFLIVPNASHSDDQHGLMASISEKAPSAVLDAILEMLKVNDRRSYQAMARACQQKTETLQKEDTHFDGSHLDRYAQVVVEVTDQYGDPISDYALEFVDGQGRSDQFPSGFLAHSVQSPLYRERFTFFLNFDQLLKIRGGRVGVIAAAVPRSMMVSFEPAVFDGPASAVEQWLAPNETTYLKLELKRRVNKNVLRLTKNLGYQKIEGKAAEDEWIED